MAHHLILFSVMAIVSISNKNRKVCLLFAFCILYIFSALRYKFGNDYMSYFNKYEEIQAGKTIYDEQILFELLNKICSNFYVFIAFTSFFLLFAVYKLIITHVDMNYAWISVIIFLINPYLFLMSLSSIRQTLATVLFIWAVQFSRKRQIVPYILLIMIASLIHASAIILLPFYFIANEKKVGSIQLLVFLSVFFALLLDGDLLNSFLNKGMDILSFETYKQYGDFRNSLRATLLTMITFVYVLLNIRKLEGNALMYTKLYLIGLCFGILAYRVALLTRLQMYFDIFSIASIPMIMRKNMIDKSNVSPLMIRKNITSGKEYPLMIRQNTINGSTVRQILGIANRYLFPALIFIIYILRYYSFFVNPLWKAFFEYQTIFSIW